MEGGGRPKAVQVKMACDGEREEGEGEGESSTTSTGG